MTRSKYDNGIDDFLIKLVMVLGIVTLLGALIFVCVYIPTEAEKIHKKNQKLERKIESMEMQHKLELIECRSRK